MYELQNNFGYSTCIVNVSPLHRMCKIDNSGLTVTELEPSEAAFSDSADQDQTAQNVLSDHKSTLSATL